MGSLFKKFTIALICVANVVLGLFDLPVYPTKDLDMSKFQDEPVFADEFDSGSLDESKWTGHLHGVQTYTRKGGFWNNKMASVEEDGLHIRTAYFPEGLDGGPAGWYSTALDTSNSHLQKFGYYECRCKMPKGVGLWSAFWIYVGSVGDTTMGGINGAEIDVMESPFYYKPLYRYTTKHTIHIDGYEEYHRQKSTKNIRIPGDPYNEFHTYGVEWNEKEYIFYIDGKESGRTDFGGTSQVEEYMILSVEVGGEKGIPAKSWSGPSIDENGKDFIGDFVVDYVRTYEYK